MVGNHEEPKDIRMDPVGRGRFREMEWLTRAGDGLISTSPVVSIANRASRYRLRVLAYHSVSDGDSFAYQIRYIRDHFQPVSSAEVIAALDGDHELAPSSVWVTFDDGDPSIVTTALPILRAYEIEATAFICPGLVASTRPFWWQLVDFALASGIHTGLKGRTFGKTDAPDLVRTLKRVSDVERRRVVESIAADVENVLGSSYQRQQISMDALKEFAESGGTIANHTWDHPCLDRCAPDEQARQIRLAHEWLMERFPQEHLCFAYPNGNYSDASERVVDELGYGAALLFDHRLTRKDQPRFRLSRLRVSDTTPPHRFAAILSGVHPLIHALRGKW